MGTILLCFVGMPAAGKSTIAKILSDGYGANWIRTRDVVSSIRASQTIVELQNDGLVLSVGKGAEDFHAELKRRVKPGTLNVVDSIRPPLHWQNILAQYGSSARLIGVISAKFTRAERFAVRETSGDIAARDDHPIEKDVPDLIESADYVVMNNSNADRAAELLVDYALSDYAPSLAEFLAFTRARNVALSEIRMLPGEKMAGAREAIRAAIGD